MATSLQASGRRRGSATFRSTTRLSSSSTATPARSSDHPERLTAASATTALVRSRFWIRCRFLNCSNTRLVECEGTEVGLLAAVFQKWQNEHSSVGKNGSLMEH